MERKRVNTLTHSSQRNYLRLIFYRAYKMDEEEEYSPREIYYPEDLETSNVEIETGTCESREVIDNFINKQKCTNTNKKMATDLNTLLH